MPALVRIEQRFDIVMTFAERCKEMEGSFELRGFNPNDDPLDRILRPSLLILSLGEGSALISTVE
jgi:hypothetical protein